MFFKSKLGIKPMAYFIDQEWWELLFKEVWTLGKWKYWCQIDHKTRYLGYADYEIHAHWMGQLRGYYVC